MNTVADISVAGIIPARYASTRFPGKPLAMIGDKSVIHRVYEQASAALSNVFVATDDQRIFDAVSGFGGKAVMTSADHQSGTDRCAEAVDTLAGERGLTFDIIVNIQGDEPFIRPDQINMLTAAFGKTDVMIATLIRECSFDEDLFNPNHPKVITDLAGDAIYFSRAAIPYLRDHKQSEWVIHHRYFKHIGIYAFRSDVLRKITKLPPGRLETAESLEQNRWIENGFRIRTVLTDWQSIGIDTPEDLEKAKIFLNHFK